MKRLKVLTVLVAMAAILTACGGNKADEAAAPGTAAETTEAAVEETAEETAEETIEETTAAGVNEESEYSMLQGVVQNLSEDKSTFSLLCDDGVTREIAVSDICDVEVDIENGVQIAIACIGEITDDLSGVTLVVALPEQEEWNIQTKTGITTSNGMSAFVIETHDGESIPFLKDNCPMDSGALSEDDGTWLTVTYVNAMDNNFPIDIKYADEWSEP